MPKGLPKSYIKKYGISKRAWREYRKSKSRKGKTTKKSGKTKKRSVKRIGRRKSFLNLRSIYKYLRLMAFAYPAIDVYMREKDIKKTVGQYAGMWEDKFDVNVLKRAWLPLLATTLITVGVGKVTSMIRDL